MAGSIEGERPRGELTNQRNITQQERGSLSLPGSSAKETQPNAEEISRRQFFQHITYMGGVLFGLGIANGPIDVKGVIQADKDSKKKYIPGLVVEAVMTVVGAGAVGVGAVKLAADRNKSANAPGQNQEIKRDSQQSSPQSEKPE